MGSNPDLVLCLKDKRVRKGKTEYLVRWLVFPVKDDSWTSERDVKAHLSDHLKYFEYEQERVRKNIPDPIPVKRGKTKGRGNKDETSKHGVGQPPTKQPDHDEVANLGVIELAPVTPITELKYCLRDLANVAEWIEHETRQETETSGKEEELKAKLKRLKNENVKLEDEIEGLKTTIDQGESTKLEVVIRIFNKILKTPIQGEITNDTLTQIKEGILCLKNKDKLCLAHNVFFPGNTIKPTFH